MQLMVQWLGHKLFFPTPCKPVALWQVATISLTYAGQLVMTGLLGFKVGLFGGA